MKSIHKFPLYFFFLVLIALICVETSSAQFKASAPSPYHNTGNVIKVEQNQPMGGLQNFFNMKMSHSYEATFSSYNGQFANLNMYTNTMMFSFTPKLTGRLDLAFAHSPFGNGYPGMQNQQNNSQFLIRNAEINYQFSKNTNISFSYQELPYGSGWGMGYGNNQYQRLGLNAWSWD